MAIKSLGYYHQHHHLPDHPDGMPEEEWSECGVSEGAGVMFGGMWIFFIFLIFILLLLM
jgi:hypothetical protein